MIIYADILLAVNWWVDFLILLGTARLIGIGTRRWRLILGSFVGSLFSVVLFLPALSMPISLLIKITTAALMVCVTFGICDRRRLAQSLLSVFGLSAGISGLSGALYFFIAPPRLYVFNGVVYYDVSPWVLLGLTTLCYGILCAIEKIVRHRAPQNRRYMLQITYNGRMAQVCCLYDSGNHLVEPFSNRPVLVVERASIETLMHVPINATDLPPNGKWRIIPFNTLGGEGILPAYLSDRVSVIMPHDHIVLPPCYIAICEKLGRGEYQGLIGTALGDYITS